MKLRLIFPLFDSAVNIDTLTYFKGFASRVVANKCSLLSLKVMMMMH